MKRFIILILLMICVPVFAQRKLTTNEAVKLSVGPFFDSTDGITPETGITVTALTVEIYREFDADTTPTRFANFAPTASGGNNDMALITSSVSGVYSLEVTAAQLNFTGPMMLTIVDTDSAGIVGLPFWRYFNLTAANVVDAEYGTDKLEVDLIQVNGNSTPIDNWEATFDGTGYADDVAPATQLQVSTLAGGIAVMTEATGINIDEPNGGEQTLTYAATASHDGAYHEVASDDANDDIDFYYIFNTGDGDNLPVDFHFDGYYEDNNGAPSSTMVIQSYHWNIDDWETIATLTDSASDVNLDLPLHVHDVSPTGGTEGEVWIRFNLTTPEESQNVLVDHVTVGYVSGGLTVAAIVDEWESQSQADPTGFHVNLLEVEGTDATTYWESRSLAAAAYFLFGTDPVELLDSGGSVGTSAAELVVDVWDKDISGVVAADYAGTILNAILADTSATDTSAEWLALLSAVDTDATSATHDPAYVTLEAGKASNDAYNGMSIAVTDATDGNTETRRIEDYTSGRLVTFDRALSFTPVQDDIVRIYSMPYNITAAFAGGSENTYIITDTGAVGGTPIADVSVWVTVDAAGARLVVSGVTDDSGEVIFYLDAGTTYYVWMKKSGYSFSDNGESWLAE